MGGSFGALELSPSPSAAPGPERGPRTPGMLRCPGGGVRGRGDSGGRGGKIPKSVRDPRFNPHSQGRILPEIGVFAPPAPPAPLGEGESALAERKEPSGSSRRRSRPLFQPSSRIKFPFPAFLCPFSVPFLPSPACPSSCSLPFVPSSPSLSLKKPKKGGKLPTMEAEAAEYFPVPLIIPGLSLGVNKCGEKSISGRPRISLCLSLPAKILRGKKNSKKSHLSQVLPWKTCPGQESPAGNAELSHGGKKNSHFFPPEKFRCGSFLPARVPPPRSHPPLVSAAQNSCPSSAGGTAGGQ